MKESIDQIIQLFNKYTIEITEQQGEQFFQYYQLLVEKNKVVNLTAITEFSEVIVKHFLDSAMLLSSFTIEKNARIIDIGTVAGFPGIPLKILRPDLQITLLDSLNKRIVFLQEVIARLALENIEAVHGRAEDIARQEIYREQYDVSVSRAVAGLNVLSELSVPFLKVGGSFVSYKSVKAEEELSEAESALRVLNCQVEGIKNFRLEEEDAERKLIIIRKKEQTNKKYPRKAGIPGKKPL